jgi:hypothetical protein
MNFRNYWVAVVLLFIAITGCWANLYFIKPADYRDQYKWAGDCG